MDEPTHDRNTAPSRRRPRRECKMKPAFASFDIETDGNNPGQYSMRSIGVAVFVEGELTPVDTFYAHIKPVFKDMDPKCKVFWSKHQAQWQHINTNMISIEECMSNLSIWLSDLSDRQRYNIKWVANPSNFDWMFLKCNYELYGPVPKYDIGFYCHDLSSLMRVYLKMHDINDKQAFMARLAGDLKYTHNALDDALYQGVIYVQLRRLIEEDVGSKTVLEE